LFFIIFCSDPPPGYPQQSESEKTTENSNLRPSTLQTFWKEQMAEIENSNDLKSHGLPLQRIKKIMKSDEEIKVKLHLITFFYVFSKWF
jgi:uncharacterized protein YaaN involved in tellurite resistance